MLNTAEICTWYQFELACDLYLQLTSLEIYKAKIDNQTGDLTFSMAVKQYSYVSQWLKYWLVPKGSVKGLPPIFHWGCFS